MKRQGGFTLIEMVVVIVILGILAVTAAPKFIDMQDDAKTGALSGLKSSVMSAAEIAHAGWLLDKTKSNFTSAGFPEGSKMKTLIEYDSNVFTAKTETADVLELRYGSDSSKCLFYTVRVFKCAPKT